MRKNTVVVVAYPDRSAGNDPKLFFLILSGGRGGRGEGGGVSLSPPRLNIFTVGNMGVMICLGQGGLHSLSASSFLDVLGIFLLFGVVCCGVLTSLVLAFVSSPMASVSGVSVNSPG